MVGPLDWMGEGWIWACETVTGGAGTFLLLYWLERAVETMLELAVVEPPGAPITIWLAPLYLKAFRGEDWLASVLVVGVSSTIMTDWFKSWSAGVSLSPAASTSTCYI